MTEPSPDPIQALPDSTVDCASNSGPSSTTSDTSTKKFTRAKRRTLKKKRQREASATEGHTPWLETLGMTEYESKEQRLHDEIVAFLEYMRPTIQERRARELVTARVTDIVKRRFPTGTVTLFGSAAHDLVLPDGDIDLVVQTPQVYEDAFKTRSLFQLSSMLRTALVTRGGQVAVGAKVPVLSFPTVFPLGSFDFDISINAEDGTKAIPVVKGYLESFPPLRPLVLVVKALLSQQGLNSPANGGLGSYAIICLVLCFLKLNPKHHPVEYIQNHMESESLGTLVMDFLDYFGNEFPYSTSYVAAAQGKILPKESLGWTNKDCPEALSIECLINPGRDIGKATSRIAQVRSAFQEALTALKEYPFSMSQGNILGSALGVSCKTLDRRKHLKHIVDSGSLESDLAAIVLPPEWSTPQNPKPQPPRGRRRPPPQNAAPYHIPYHPSYSAYAGAYAPIPVSQYPHNTFRPSYSSYGPGPTYLNYGSPSPALHPAQIPHGSSEDVHRAKRQRI